MTLNGSPLPELEQVVIQELRTSRANLLFPATLRQAADEFAGGHQTSLNELTIAAIAYVLKTMPSDVLEYLRQASKHENTRRAVRKAAALRSATADQLPLSAALEG